MPGRHRPEAGAKVKAAACTGAATQKWVIGQVSANDFGRHRQHRHRQRPDRPRGSTINGTQLVMGPNRGDLSYPWRVSYHHYALS